jgi:hypothetical protein
MKHRRKLLKATRDFVVRKEWAELEGLPIESDSYIPESEEDFEGSEKVESFKIKMSSGEKS